MIDAAEIVPENESNTGLKAWFGVVVDVFGHYLGLPHLYDKRGRLQTRDYVGPWTLIARGSWLRIPDGSAPSELEAYSRILLGSFRSRSKLDKGRRFVTSYGYRQKARHTWCSLR